MFVETGRGSGIDNEYTRLSKGKTKVPDRTESIGVAGVKDGSTGKYLLG